jgi:predicted LPLAT superfamily acyltransferase
MFGVYRTIGRTAFRVALVPVIGYFLLFNGTARRSSLAFLRRVHAVGGGPWPRDAIPGWRHSFLHFKAFGETMLDKLAAWSGSLKHVSVRCEGREQLEAWCNAKRGAILLTSHLGNIEALRALSSQRTSLRINVLVHTRNSEKFSRMLRSMDTNVVTRLIEVTDLNPATAMMLMQRVEEGEFVVIAADRTPVAGGRTRAVPFLGETVALPIGGLMLAAVLHCQIGMITALREGGGFRLIVERLGDFSAVRRAERDREMDRILRLYAERLGRLACRYPYQWFNFFDFWAHERKADESRGRVAACGGRASDS